MGNRVECCLILILQMEDIWVEYIMCHTKAEWKGNNE
ncbi:MAG: hypothetical protein EOM00_13970 [Clostridia bacterium]|nr:hypothetical protein [Clostridia bacterium]